MMEVEVEELWTNTVTSIPTTSPATGLDRMAFSWKISPATLPGRKRQTVWHLKPNLVSKIVNKTENYVSMSMLLYFKMDLNGSVSYCEYCKGERLMRKMLMEESDCLPPASWKAELKMSSEHTKRYRSTKSSGILQTADTAVFTRCVFGWVSMVRSWRASIMGSNSGWCS